MPSSLLTLATIAAASVTPSQIGRQPTGKSIELQIEVTCSPAEAFALWTTPEGLGFFAPMTRIDGRVGKPFEFMFEPEIDPEGARHGTKGARLLGAVLDRFVAFEWDIFAGDRSKGNSSPPFAPPEVRMERPLPTWVEVTIAASAAGSTIDLRHYGFREAPLWEESRQWFTSGWGGVLEAMKGRCSELAGSRRKPVNSR